MKMVYLCPKYWVQQKMSRVRFHQIEAIGKIIEVVWSGPDWENYNNNQTVEENVVRLCQGQPDLISVFDPRKLIDLNKTTALRCMQMNEMHAPDGSRQSALELLQPFQFIVCHHENEMNDPFFKSIRERCVHIPHSSNKDIFFDYGQDKTVDVLLVGSLILDKYKLRKRFVTIIDKLKHFGFKAKIHQNPGGIHADSHTNKYLVEFAKAINSAKICLTCSSIYKCAFGKYSEIPMCRTMIGGDVPGERQDFFKQFMLTVEDNDTDKAIVNKIADYLKNDVERRRMTDLGYQLTHAEYTMEHYAQRFVKAANDRLHLHHS